MKTDTCEICGKPVADHRDGLKCCPFCGEQPFGFGESLGEHWVVCDCDGCEMHSSPSKTIAAWNTRAPISQPVNTADDCREAFENYATATLGWFDLLDKHGTGHPECGRYCNYVIQGHWQSWRTAWQAALAARGDVTTDDGWVSVHDRHWPMDEPFLARVHDDEGGYICMAEDRVGAHLPWETFASYEDDENAEYGMYVLATVTHWMPLPPDPPVVAEDESEAMPDCPKCGDSQQVWRNQQTGNLTCHRAWCHTEITESEADDD